MLFRYKAIRLQSGQQVKGKIQAKSREEAIARLKEQGVYPSELVETKPSIWTKELHFGGRPVTSAEFVIFCRQLATLLRSGTTIVESIRLLAEQAKSKAFRNALAQVYSSVRSGTAFSEACSEFPHIFDSIFVNMVRAGELTGEMDEVMERLAIFYEKEFSIKEKMKSALAYPIAVSLVAIVVVVLLLTTILPNLVSSLLASGGTLPAPTAIVLGVSNFLIDYWYVLVLFITGICFLFVVIRRQEKGRYYIDYMILKLPIIGGFIQKMIIARMTRTLQSLIASAVPILQALTMAAETINNQVIAQVVRDSRESLRNGDRLSEPFEKSWVFPKLVAHMLQVGEETGRLDILLGKTADYYETETDHVAARISKVIEPLMIVVLAVVVGTILLAALLPMFEIYKQF